MDGYGLGASLAATGVNALLGVTGLDSQSEANRLNQQNFREQMKFARYQYEDTKKYNSMQEQVKRMRAAGLNPALATSALGAGMQSSVSQPSANPQQPLDLGGLASIGRNISTVGSEISRQVAEANLMKENSLNMRKQNMTYDMRLMTDIQEQMSRVDKNTQEYFNLKRQYDILDWQFKYDQSTFQARTKKAENEADLVAAQQAGQLLVNTFQQLTNDAFPQLNEAQLRLLAGQTFQALMSGSMSREGAKLNKAMTEREMVKKVGDIIDNGIKANEFKLSDLGLTSAQLQALRDGRVLEDVQDGFKAWLDNELYYLKNFTPRLPKLPVSMFLPIKKP